MNKFQEKLVSGGYCDERGAGFCATAVALPGGEYGIVALCVKESRLYLYDIDMRNNMGELLYTADLKKIENLKIKTGILSQQLRFDYDGFTYKFTNFVGVKPAFKVIEEEANR